MNYLKSHCIYGCSVVFGYLYTTYYVHIRVMSIISATSNTGCFVVLRAFRILSFSDFATWSCLSTVTLLCYMALALNPCLQLLSCNCQTTLLSYSQSLPAFSNCCSTLYFWETYFITSISVKTLYV